MFDFTMLLIIQNPLRGPVFLKNLPLPVTCDFWSTSTVLATPCLGPGLTRAAKNEEYAVLSNKCGKFVKILANDKKNILKIFRKKVNYTPIFRKRAYFYRLLSRHQL